ncbi:hypothetical protein GCM10023116_19490 [Kistimonas scapharcae]|uniref:Uncharacterized protein n=2 Tax=Kistimonas scapharcae TaxID=1036133 RepID=A0ABP8V353_9GAMM
MEGESPDKAFNLVIGRGGGGRPTPNNLKKKSDLEIRNHSIAMYIASRMAAGATIYEASEELAEKVGLPDKDGTFKDYYVKKKRSLSPEMIEYYSSNENRFDTLLDFIKSELIGFHTDCRE